MKEFPYDLIYAATKELVNNGYPNEKLEQLMKKMAYILRTDYVIFAIYEKNKDIFRIITGNKALLSTKYKHVAFKNRIIKINGENYYIRILSVNSHIIGAFLTHAPIKDEFESIVNSFSLVFFLSYEYLYTKKRLFRMQKLLEITDMFEHAPDNNVLLENFMKTIFETIKSELVIMAKKSKEDYKVISSIPSNLKNMLIPGLSDFAFQVFTKEPSITIKPSFEYNPLNFEIKSYLSIPIKIETEIFWIVFFNKFHETGYTAEKSFEVMDLEIANDAAKRFSLASTRLSYYERLKHEIENLKMLKEEHEKLIFSQKDQLRKMNVVHYISQAMRSSYDVNNVLKILLIGLTSGRTLGFNRALLLLKDQKKDVLIGKAWVGPANEKEVETIWKKANQRAMRYADIVQYLREEALSLITDNVLSQKINGMIFPYRSHRFLERAVIRRKVVHINNRIIQESESSLDFLIPLLDVEEFVIAPLVGKSETIGVVILDNKYSKHPITPADVEILRIISDSAGLAIENATGYEELKAKTISLERQKNLIEYLRDFSESVLQNLSAAVVVLDKKGLITEWNKKAETYFGRAKEHMIGQKLGKLGTEFEDIEGMAEEVLKLKEEIQLSSYLIPIAGHEKFYDIHISPLWDVEHLMLRGTIVTFEDVTERVMLERERKRQEKLAALGEMAARVAHELRNPISVLGGFVKRLEKYADDEKARKRYLKIISDEIIRLEEIVSEILEFSRDAKKIEFTTFNINEVISEVYLLHEEKIKSKNILFEFKAESEIIEVTADRSRIKQVLINLLQNALDETPSGGKIELSIERSLKGVKVRIWNQGEPLTHDILEKLFTPFFTTKVQGTGLGLPICKKIIEDEHGGKIWVEPDENGNAFLFEIPIKSE
ncbi:PAS domain S-box protein [Thermosipho ferrireducens]|uniref:histidine kinase n=1 Tax=Thermosipho ferrireducens TaxID=2571116 RepID=A0ABX7S426_9BACT|nr:GAF domain-containing sensor histidine kinase [Thermosipho ferrireducens]QTA37164.1 PAS domain S-box protein [Thermosipho ferrireducens]